MNERERLVELILECDKSNEVLSCFNERPRKRQAAEIIADDILANGALYPPCKVGDTVYSISGGKVAKGVVESIHQNLVGNERGRWIVTAWFDDFYANSKEAGFECGTHLYPPFDNFGKTVFLSRDLAEKALAERQGANEDN